MSVFRLLKHIPLWNPWEALISLPFLDKRTSFSDRKKIQRGQGAHPNFARYLNTSYSTSKLLFWGYLVDLGMREFWSLYYVSPCCISISNLCWYLVGCSSGRLGSFRGFLMAELMFSGQRFVELNQTTK